ncbi:leucine-rich repeat and immunoglobulin-like domain-containing nogo receptor-interacting 3 isoform A [Chlorella sorokiniana]|uniref:Leucine-rich repeat and immunoglobulin-like domain-containing nogo receptor-interacting 3 isoform A n=1 Tax=Chlorella sorokiniana TaxID=3076 RepID=A0A2P6TF21_CHLSO|nr:leucine-rich repeat and immunoglobulin-like domain-containing nogo receptor-interacting 3 isoform A [Chlorella sorokiniana]|eukprot:PRW32574.1 leucine-rich repeat and immunoglobulin-like domain-containing nogo receptor-interacting 3 isoform A [Chlorella sorokiniana]
MDELPDALIDRILAFVPARPARVLPLLLGRGLIVSSRGAVEQVCQRWRARALALAPRVEIELPMISSRLAAYVRMHAAEPVAMLAVGLSEQMLDAMHSSTRPVRIPVVPDGLDLASYRQLAESQVQRMRQEAQEAPLPYDAMLAAWLVSQLHGRTPAAVYFNAGHSRAVHVWRFLADALLPTATRSWVLPKELTVLRLDTSALAVLQKLTTVQHLHLASCRCPGDGLPLLAHLTGLHLDGTTFGEDKLPHSFPPNLRALRLRLLVEDATKDRTAVLDRLAELEHLEALSVAFPPIDAWRQYDAADAREAAALALKQAAAAAGLRCHVGSSPHAPPPFAID